MEDSAAGVLSDASSGEQMGGTALRWVPKNILKSVRLCVDGPVELREESGRIVIEPMRHKEFDIAELLDGITRKNVHQETDAGAPARNEVW